MASELSINPVAIFQTAICIGHNDLQFVIRARYIVSVLSPIDSFSNHRSRLESYRVSQIIIVMRNWTQLDV